MKHLQGQKASGDCKADLIEYSWPPLSTVRAIFQFWDNFISKSGYSYLEPITRNWSTSKAKRQAEIVKQTWLSTAGHLWAPYEPFFNSEITLSQSQDKVISNPLLAIEAPPRPKSKWRLLSRLDWAQLAQTWHEISASIFGPPRGGPKMEAEISCHVWASCAQSSLLNNLHLLFGLGGASIASNGFEITLSWLWDKVISELKNGSYGAQRWPAVLNQVCFTISACLLALEVLQLRVMGSR